MYTVEEKKRYIQMRKNGMTAKEVYQVAKNEREISCTESTFERAMRKWASRETLEAGTYDGFIPYAATVQVDKNGNIRQAWIKQEELINAAHDIVEEIKKNITPIRIKSESNTSERMLEIPIYDAHFPFSDYLTELRQIITIIEEDWENIVIIIGQDLFHNDSLTHGRTSKGTEIEKIDIVDAWRKATMFFDCVITESIRHSQNVKLIYSMGNHDETVGWCFVQMLKEKYPQLDVDDEAKQRKCVFWKGCFIGITHGHTIKNSLNDLRGQFTIEFPMCFAQATIREIHCGHLHHEEANDLYGIVIRRLPSAVPSDAWSRKEGFVGSHKRFMLFEWRPNTLSSIRFV